LSIIILHDFVRFSTIHRHHFSLAAPWSPPFFLYHHILSLPPSITPKEINQSTTNAKSHHSITFLQSSSTIHPHLPPLFTTIHYSSLAIISSNHLYDHSHYPQLHISYVALPFPTISTFSHFPFFTTLTTMFTVNDRVSINGDFATVKFVGSISPWPNTVALGVEWDNPAKGKNDGSVNGTQYFTTRHDHGGSFIKITNSTLSPRSSFIASLIHNYGANFHFHEVAFGGKYTESAGFEKLNSITANFPQLTSVSLERKNIYISGVFDQFHLTNLRYLDVSFNLFSDFGEIITILHHCPNLTQLNLNGNRFISVPRCCTVTFAVKTLNLCCSFMEIDDVNSVLAMFPKLQELALAGNKYTDIDLQRLQLGSTPDLGILDVSYNELTTIPVVDVANVKLANNFIKTLDSDISFGSLDLRNNRIDSWNEIDKLAGLQLRELRINGNGVFDGMTIDEQTIHLIARLKFYGKLNGSKITDDEITNAELYFISLVQRQKIVYENKKRWHELVVKYHIADDESSNFDATTTTSLLQKKRLRLKLVYGDETWTRTVLEDNSVLRLKGIIGRKWQISVLEFDVYYLIGTIKVYLDDDIAHVGQYGICGDEEIYVEVTNPKIA
jgi:Leucine-rich repeat (LRR) protein